MYCTTGTGTWKSSTGTCIGSLVLVTEVLVREIFEPPFDGNSRQTNALVPARSKARNRLYVDGN